MHSPTANIVKKLRSFGLSQTEIHRRTDIPQSRLSRWENGEVPKGADDALKLDALLKELESGQPADAAERPTRADEAKH
jgi:transcriptional regulator with XRE-family HTH domain